MSRMRRLAAFATALTITATGLAGAATTSATASSAAKRPTITVHIGPGRVVYMPDQIRPGTQRFAVSSARESGFQLLRPDAGYLRQEAARDVNAAFLKNNMKALKRFESHVTLVGGVFSGPDRTGVMVATLQRGLYWAVDTNKRVVEPRLIKRVHVTGTRVYAGEPSGSVIRAVDETKWAKRPTVIPHKGRLTFRNDSIDNHFVELARLAPGKTMKDFTRWINQAKKGKQVPPPIEENIGTGTGVVSPGLQMTMRYDLPPGHYVLICFWPDADMGGLPHAFMGMYRGIRLK